MTSPFPIGRTAENITDIVQCEMIINILSVLYVLPLKHSGRVLLMNIGESQRLNVTVLQKN